MRRTMAAAFTVLALGLTGCSDSGQPSEPPTPSEPLTTSSPTTSDDAPTTEPAPPPETESPSETASTEIPPEATEDSEAGAEAFVKSFLETFNRLGQSPEDGVLSKFSRDNCETCSNLESAIEQLVSAGHRTSGPAISVHDVSAVNLGGTTRVEAHLEQLGGELLDENGEVVQTAEAGGEFVYVFTLSRDGDQWLIDEVLIQE